MVLLVIWILGQILGLFNRIKHWSSHFNNREFDLLLNFETLCILINNVDKK